MQIDIFKDINGQTVRDNAVEYYETKGTAKPRFKVWWSKIPSKSLSASQMNKELDGLDESLTYKETDKGCKTISTLHKLVGSYFVRAARKDSVEICGVKEENDNLVFFRFVTNKTQEGDLLNGGEAYSLFKKGVEEEYGKTVHQIYGSLPGSYHNYRYVCPIQLDWCARQFTGKVVDGICKADVSSAYGFELTKTLPDLHAAARKEVKGRVAPNEEYPFAFYLKSGHMAIWGEGSSWDYYDRRYFVEVRKRAVRDVAPEDDITLLCRKASVTLGEFIERLYAARNVSPENKAIMNLTVGMWWRKEYFAGMEVMWPLSAVVHFRCNARMADIYESLLNLGQVPILINTDSITWVGDDTSLVQPKKLGSFTLEHKDAKMIIQSVKAYQISDYSMEKGEEVCLTRWSGRRKQITENLAFGDILDPCIGLYFKAEEDKNLYRWDEKRKRFIARNGGIFDEN